ncbi:MAG TPA: L-histidine N(alpha)-methyltransferase [Pyrinomonadaceae bacterium]|jgi:dimethylhistidine N-methyltransferase|nr:L-histidine N(alpha)-methyltransferase [Pyrinomonadaceae bacterium]
MATTTSPQTELQRFADDVRKGLEAAPKTLSSKYFYDDEGSRIFQEIMKLPEYYLTRCEREIFQQQAADIYQAFKNENASFDLIELGPGDGSKTALLIDHFLKQSADFTYVPIDISAEALRILSDNFQAKFPDLTIREKNGDYFRMLETLKEFPDERTKIVFFLGSNIGNFRQAESLVFFQRLSAAMSKDDLLFIGVDLQKDPRVILPAYDDPSGVTSAFNLNLLKRMNRELDADFAVENFMHYASYQPTDGAARSYLISREKQTVRVGALGQSFEFAQWEPIYMEISQKYTLEMLEKLAEKCGFRIVKNFFDQKNYYTNSLWKALR